MERYRLAVPEGQRYSCLQCGESCRWWRIEVAPEERDRILEHDWAAERPHLDGIALFEEQRVPGAAKPVLQLAQVDGHCVFLEDDGLCLIHRTLGMEAKPSVCQAYPFIVLKTVDGLTVAVNYGCTALIRNVGADLEDTAPLADVPADGAAAGPLLAPPEPALSAGTRLDWKSYLALEAATLGILKAGKLPIVGRLAAAGSLISSAAARWAGKPTIEAGQFAAWLAELEAGGYARAMERGANLPKVPPLRPRAVIAPFIADVETASLRGGGRTGFAIGRAVAIVNRSGTIHLYTLRGDLDLATMRSVGFDQDSPRFDDVQTRFLTNYVMRKSLLGSRTLREGFGYLALCFAVMRWYAVASAAMAGRRQVQEEDVVRGIMVVEKAYSHRMGLRSGVKKGFLDTMLKLEMEFLVPPAGLLRSYQPVSEKPPNGHGQ